MGAKKLSFEDRQLKDEMYRLVLRRHALTSKVKHQELLKEATSHRTAHLSEVVENFFQVVEKRAPKVVEQAAKDLTVKKAFMRFFQEPWVRPIEDWKPKSKNVYKQLLSLVQHLICKYPLPNVYYSLWVGEEHEFVWFTKLAAGLSLKHLNLPIELSAQMRHQVQFAPSHLSFKQALRWAQLTCLGADRSLINAVLATPLGLLGPRGETDQNKHEWLLLFNMFIRNPMFDRAQVRTVYDYMMRHPRFSLKGRTPISVMRLVEDWHTDLKRSQGKNYKSWDHWAIQDYVNEEGMVGEKSHKIWTITQLLDSKELAKEGRALSHCVWSYTDSCVRGLKAIYSLALNGEKLITIELLNSFAIVQVRGKGNRMPTQQEKRIVGLWATKEGLTYRYN